jgi:hypothetical protein
MPVIKPPDMVATAVAVVPGAAMVMSGAEL